MTTQNQDPAKAISAAWAGFFDSVSPDKAIAPIRQVCAAPFDAMRAQYASAVRCGLVQRSLVASAHFESFVGGLEQAALGPLARRRA